MNNYKLINSFKFKPIKIARSYNNSYKRISKKVEGLCIIEHGEYKVRVFNNNTLTSFGDLVLPFTEESYEVKGRETIFTKVFNADEKVIRHIRTKLHAKNFPMSKDNYVPFANNWIVNGYIVTKNDTQYFDFIDIVAKQGYDYIPTNYEE